MSHSLLWQKLSHLGVSSKIIQVIKGLYDHASLRVRSEGRFTEKIDITEGVLQGESLSPTLFLLFLSDIEVYLRERGHAGPSIDSLHDVLCLLFADDLVLLSSFEIHMFHLLKDLESYFLANHLTINVSKTKLIVFRSGGRLSLLPSFPLKIYNEEVEIVSTYTYLGVVFASSAKGWRATQAAIAKDRIAVGTVMSILSRANANSWEASTKLAAPAWALQYTEDIETIQFTFL